MANRSVRGALWVVIAAQGLLTVLFVLGTIVDSPLWPFPGTTAMSSIFLGSFAAAAATSTAVAILLRSERALVGIGFDYLLIFGPFAVATGLKLGDLGTNGAIFLVTAVIALAIGGAMVRWGLGHGWRNPMPTPTPIRVAFFLFIVALVIAGGLMLAQAPNILPWQITPELSTLFGFLFLGAAAYFAFGLLDPGWENAAGQLAGFLAYDVVLIVPFLARLPDIPDHFRMSLIIYLVVVIGSGVLAVWYLVVRPETRIRLAAPIA